MNLKQLPLAPQQDGPTWTHTQHITRWNNPQLTAVSTFLNMACISDYVGIIWQPGQAAPARQGQKNPGTTRGGSATGTTQRGIY